MNTPPKNKKPRRKHGTDTMTVTLEALPCSEEELDRRLLVVYRLFGYLGGNRKGSGNSEETTQE